MDIKYLTINVVVLTAVLSIVLTNTVMYYAFADKGETSVKFDIDQDQDCDAKDRSAAGCENNVEFVIDLGENN